MGKKAPAIRLQQLPYAQRAQLQGTAKALGIPVETLLGMSLADAAALQERLEHQASTLDARASKKEL